MAFKPIEILINAKDNASGVFDSLNSKIKTIGVAIVGYFGIRAFAGMVQGAADLEQGLSRVQAATGASAKEMQALRKAAEDAGANTKFTSTEAAGALENLAKAGLSASDAIATLPAVLNLAQAGDVGLGEASEFVTKAVMGMGLAFTDAARVADVLALGANATNTSVTGLAQALSYAAPVAQSAGVSLEGTVAILGKMSDAGIDASRSGTALANMLAQFSDPASTFKRELAAAGITTNNFEEALHQLAAAGPAGEKAILAVGLNAGPALRAMLNQGMPALDELKAKLDAAAGSAAATAKIMRDNLNGSLDGFESTWKTVKDALSTPVLPLLKDSVDELASAFKNAVADGTIGKFGDAIATAFQAGIKWVREFVAQVDFTQVAADLRAFADRAGEVFDRVGKYATNAGGIAQTAYGVMTAGANGVLTAIYAMGVAFANTAAVILKASVSLGESLQKVSFGDAKARLIGETEQMRVALAGIQGVSTELGARMHASMLQVAEGAQTARDGIAGLNQTVNDGAPALDASSKAMSAVAQELMAGAEAAAAAGVAFAKKAAADQAAKKSSDEHSAAVSQLKKEYRALIDGGDLQAAAEKIKEINKALSDTPNAAKDATAAALAVENAFTSLGVVSSEKLSNLANAAKSNYEIIKNAGTSTAEDVSRAFEKAAEAAIAANKGVAPPWVAAEAAAKGFAVAVDDAGKASIKAAAQGSKAINKTAQDFAQTTQAVNKTSDAYERLLMRYKQSSDYTERQLELLEKENALLERREALEDKRLNRDKEGFSLNTGGKRVNMAVETQASTYKNAKSQGLTEAQALKIAAEFINERGEQVGWQRGGAQGQSWSLQVQKAIDEIVLKNAQDAVKAQAESNNASTAAATAPAAPAPAAPVAPVVAAAPTAAHVINITLDTGEQKEIGFFDSTSQQAAADLIKQLARAGSTALRR